MRTRLAMGAPEVNLISPVDQRWMGE